MYRKTGENALGAGVYHSACPCRVELVVRKGDRFPDCPKCKHLVGWMFTRSVLQQAPASRRSAEDTGTS